MFGLKKLLVLSVFVLLASCGKTSDKPFPKAVLVIHGGAGDYIKVSND